MRGKDIELDNVSIKFGNFTAVYPTDLKIKAGEFFSILGPSGCGKTTILRMISGFLTPTTGEIRIGGEPMTGDYPPFVSFQLAPSGPFLVEIPFAKEASSQ